MRTRANDCTFSAEIGPFIAKVRWAPRLLWRIPCTSRPARFATPSPPSSARSRSPPRRWLGPIRLLLERRQPQQHRQKWRALRRAAKRQPPIRHGPRSLLHRARRRSKRTRDLGSSLRRPSRVTTRRSRARSAKNEAARAPRPSRLARPSACLSRRRASASKARFSSPLIFGPRPVVPRQGLPRVVVRARSAEARSEERAEPSPSSGTSKGRFLGEHAPQDRARLQRRDTRRRSGCGGDWPTGENQRAASRHSERQTSRIPSAANTEHLAVTGPPLAAGRGPQPSLAQRASRHGPAEIASKWIVNVTAMDGTLRE